MDEGDLACRKATAAAQDAWLCFEDEAGQNLRPPKARTWGRRGHTPVVTVSGQGSGRLSLAGLVCVKPGRRCRLLYRIRRHRGRVGERRSFSERDYADLLRGAHHQLDGRIVLIWDNLGVHLSGRMRAFASSHADWLTVIQLPAYAPDLNPAEGVWAHLKTSLGNLAVHGLDDLDRLVRTRLKRMQYRPDLIDGFLAGAGLNLNPVNPIS